MSSPHPPYSPDFVPCDFFLFPNMTFKLMPLRRSRPNHRECLTLWQKRTSRKRSKNGGDGGTSVFVQEGATSRVMVATRPYGKFYDFYSVSPKYFGYTLILSLPPCIFLVLCLKYKDNSSFTWT
jgi:hypothetical protein